VAWTLFYFIASFAALPGLPWQSCGADNFLITEFSKLILDFFQEIRGTQSTVSSQRQTQVFCTTVPFQQLRNFGGTGFLQ
jgi:hypothetical protein